MNTYSKNKQLLKDLALYIKSFHSDKACKECEELKVNQSSIAKKLHESKGKSETEYVWHFFNPKREFRILHIAMSEFRGKTRDQIEKIKNHSILCNVEEIRISKIKETLNTEKEQFLKEKEERLSKQ